MSLESLDRRLFLRGLTLLSSGLVVPRPFFSVPQVPKTDAMIFLDLKEALIAGGWISRGQIEYLDLSKMRRTVFDCSAFVLLSK
jgi:hypothetical protein